MKPENPIADYKEQRTGRNRLKRLHAAMKASYRWLEPARQRRIELNRAMAGRRYWENGELQEEPWTLLLQAQEAYLMMLAFRNPQVLCSSRKNEYRASGATVQAVMNKHLADIRFELFLRRYLRDALQAVGVCKIGLISTGKVMKYGDETYDVGEPDVDTVDLDNLIYDHVATRLGSESWVGDRYQLPLRHLLENKRYSRKAVRLVASAVLKHKAKRFGENDGDRLSDLTADHEPAGDEKWDTMVDVIDVYDKERNVVLTLSPDDEEAILQEQKWEGPPCGPYRMFGFYEIAENSFPLAPLNTLLPLHSMANTLARKLSEQAARAKTVFPTDTRDEQDADAIRVAPDGSIVPMQNVRAVNPLNIPGPDPTIFSFALQTKQLFNDMAGNVEALLGLGPQSGTASQDAMIRQNASSQFEWMGHRWNTEVKGVVGDIGWHVMRSPTFTKTVQRSYTDDPDLSYQLEYSPRKLKGSPEDYEIDIVPFSMRIQTPDQKIKGMEAVLAATDRLAPYMQQAGIMVDAQFVLQQIAELSGNPELVGSMLKFQAIPTQPMAGDVDVASSMPSRTSREYTRRSVPQTNNRGFEQAVIAKAMGAGMNPGQEARLGG